jgi:uncharacterized membrane protein
VINNHWPRIQAEFGDQLQVLFVDVSTADGSQIMRSALQAMNISSNGVPMLIIGSDVLVGSYDIPQRTPELVRARLAAGGIGYPHIPGIDALFAETAAGAPGEGAAQNALSDPANTVAVIVLVGLVVSLVMVVAAGWLAHSRKKRTLLAAVKGSTGHGALITAVLGGIVLSASLAYGSTDILPVALLAGSVTLIFIVLAFVLLNQNAPKRPSSLPLVLVALAGLIVAGYLTYIEITLSEPVCGLIGECNLVQQSPYARILGVPVGLIGIVGYIGILILSLVKREANAQQIDRILFAAALLGVIFSIYLTFLEPFVIGASCVWCLTSAVLMAILLWMTAPTGWEALLPPQKPLSKRRHHA